MELPRPPDDKCGKLGNFSICRGYDTREGSKADSFLDGLESPSIAERLRRGELRDVSLLSCADHCLLDLCKWILPQGGIQLASNGILLNGGCDLYLSHWCPNSVHVTYKII